MTIFDCADKLSEADRQTIANTKLNELSRLTQKYSEGLPDDLKDHIVNVRRPLEEQDFSQDLGDIPFKLRYIVVQFDIILEATIRKMSI